MIGKWFVRITDTLGDWTIALDAYILSLFQKAQDRLALAGYRTALIAKVIAELAAVTCFMSVLSHALVIKKAPVLGVVCILLSIFYCVLSVLVASGLSSVIYRNDRGMAGRASFYWPHSETDLAIRALFLLNTSIFFIVSVVDLFVRHQTPVQAFDNVMSPLSDVLVSVMSYIISLRYDPPTPPAPPLKGMSAAH